MLWMWFILFYQNLIFHVRYDAGGGSEERWEPRPLPPPTYASGYRPRPGGGGGSYGHAPPGDYRRMSRYSPERRGGRQEMSPPPKRIGGGWNDDDRGGYGGGGYDREMDREYDRPPLSRTHSGIIFSKNSNNPIFGQKKSANFSSYVVVSHPLILKYN